MSQKQLTDENIDERNDSTDGAYPETEIDRGPGSGSLSKQEAWASMSAQKRSASNDGRYDTRTTFYYTSDSDVSQSLRSRDRHQLHRDPSDRRGWSLLAKWNDGMRDIDGSRKQQNFDADVRRWIDTFCNFLNCTDLQRDRVELIITDQIELEEFSYQRLSAEKVILGTISMVVDEDMSVEDIEEFDIDDWIIHRDDFRTLMDDIEMDSDELWQIRKQIQKRADYFSLDHT